MTAIATNPQTAAEAQIIDTALKAGRKGSATLRLLAEAHDVAASRNMLATVEELRQHIYNLLPYTPPRQPILTARVLVSSVFVGVISGSIVSWVWRR